MRVEAVGSTRYKIIVDEGNQHLELYLHEAKDLRDRLNGAIAAVEKAQETKLDCITLAPIEVKT